MNASRSKRLCVSQILSCKFILTLSFLRKIFINIVLCFPISEIYLLSFKNVGLEI